MKLKPSPSLLPTPRLVTTALLAALLMGILPCAAESACADVAVLANVEAIGDQLRLSDLLAPGTCAPLQKAAAQVSLGVLPRGKMERVLDGQEIGRQIHDLLIALTLANRPMPTSAAVGPLGVETRPIAVRGIEAGLIATPGSGAAASAALALAPLTLEPFSLELPSRIAVQHAGAKKSCAEVARLLAGGSPQWQNQMDCAGLPSIAEDTPLEVLGTSWNPGLRRWEFALRCAQALDCVPFLLWFRPGQTVSARLADSSAGVPERSFLAAATARPSPPLIQRGQTAILTWDEAGIRVVAPVVCLDAGRFGDIVRIRFKDGQRILRAVVTGSGQLRATP
jgi:hypothetical protein